MIFPLRFGTIIAILCFIGIGFFIAYAPRCEHPGVPFRHLLGYSKSGGC